MSTKTAIVKQVRGLTLAGKSDTSPWIIMDGPENLGGNNLGVRPKELILHALGGCTASDVASILSKKKVKLDAFEVNISADVAEEHPQVFTDIKLEYVFYGSDVQEKDVERAIELSITKYCSVTAMLIKSVNITHTHKIVRPQ